MGVQSSHAPLSLAYQLSGIVHHRSDCRLVVGGFAERTCYQQCRVNSAALAETVVDRSDDCCCCCLNVARPTGCRLRNLRLKLYDVIR